MGSSKPELTFIGIGSPRCGTTWVSECLDEHPEICLSKPKELNFFNKKFPFYKKDAEGNFSLGFDWYAKHFSHCSVKAKFGEFSVYYLADKSAAKRIKDCYPDIKILVCLRNPVDQVISHINLKTAHVYRSNSYTPEQTIKLHPEFITWAKYAKQLKNYFDIFDIKNIHIILYDDIVDDSKMVIKNLYDFLKVDSNFIPPSLAKKINSLDSKQGILRTRAIKIFRIIKRIPGASFFLKKLQYTHYLKLIGIIIENIDKKYIKKTSKNNYLKLNSRQKSEWYSKFFAEDIEILEKLINRDLSSWKNK